MKFDLKRDFLGYSFTFQLDLLGSVIDRND